MKRGLFFAAVGVCAVLFPYTIYLIFFKAPLDRKLFFNQKIFYYHVPNAAMLFVSVIMCGIASFMFLRKREGRWDDLAEASGELAVLFGLIVLVTGSIWGKAAWGKWWQWDARLTTSLLLWMVMVGYVLVRKYGGPGSERLAAGLAIFGMADVPLIYFSVKIWRTLHPKTSVVKSLEPGMRGPFWLSFLLFLAMFYILITLRTRAAAATRELRELHESGLDAGVFE